MATVTDTLDRPSAAGVTPHKFAHVVLRTSRYRELITWYQTVLAAKTAFSNDLLTFLTYDDEHHRVAILHMPNLLDQQEGVAGVHHVAFTYENLGGLLNTYERLRDLGIKPVFVINHGPTSSLYYQDPDGNQIECQVDNFDNNDDADAFFHSEAFAENPVGVEFDPEDLLARLRSGESETSLKTRPKSGPKGLHDIKLR